MDTSEKEHQSCAADLPSNWDDMFSQLTPPMWDKIMYGDPLVQSNTESYMCLYPNSEKYARRAYTHAMRKAWLHFSGKQTNPLVLEDASIRKDAILWKMHDGKERVEKANFNNVLLTKHFNHSYAITRTLFVQTQVTVPPATFSNPINNPTQSVILPHDCHMFSYASAK